MHRRLFIAGTAAVATAPAWSAGLADLVARTKPSVVPVGTFNPLDSPRFTFRGSGFLVGDGSLVATCWHVLPAAAEAAEGKGTVALLLVGRDGSTTVQRAAVAASDRVHDLALLDAGRVLGPPMALASPDATREGMDVAMMGFPIGGALGFRHVTHRGIVASIVSSALPTANARQLTDAAAARLREGSFELLQLDATAYPGNSGGPLMDLADGRVVGVVNMVLLKGNRESALSQPTGITYAVPVRHLADLLRR